jgi:hypothetical protein
MPRHRNDPARSPCDKYLFGLSHRYIRRHHPLAALVPVEEPVTPICPII